MADHFDRRALWLPLAVPALATLLVSIGSRLDVPAVTPIALLAGLSFFLMGAGFIYSLPYLVLVLVVYRHVPTWSHTRLTRAFWLVPVALSTCAPLYLAVTQQVEGSPRWWDGCGDYFLVALLVGYFYSFSVATFGTWLAARSPSPGPSTSAA
jgi:hypothetical protein